MNEQFERLYKSTENFGRTQFVREIQMQINSNRKLKQENEQLRMILGNQVRIKEELSKKIDKAIKELDRVITFCEIDSQGAYDVCNMAIRNYKNIKKILGASDVND